LTRRAARRDQGRFLAEGRQAVTAGLAAGALVEVFVSPPAAERYAEELAAVAAANVPVRHADERALASLSETVTPQGIVAVARTPDATLADLARPQLIAVLCEVQDPGNAGTVIRTADAAGADAVMLTTDSVDVWNGKCVRASAGSIFHLPILTGIPVDQILANLRSLRCRVLATSGAAQRTLDNVLATGELTEPTAWLFGNEAHGLSQELLTGADQQVRVPIIGRAESLNLAGAATVCLYASAWAKLAGLDTVPVRGSRTASTSDRERGEEAR
jgi:TrmH family RNA methyltransferase